MQRFIVTGGLGFIGSNLLETLLKLDQRIIGLDNFIIEKPEWLVHLEENNNKILWNIVFCKVNTHRRSFGVRYVCLVSTDMKRRYSSRLKPATLPVETIHSHIILSTKNSPTQIKATARTA